MKEYEKNPICEEWECPNNPCDKCKLRSDWFDFWNNTTLSQNRLHQQWLCSFAVENNIPVPTDLNTTT